MSNRKLPAGFLVVALASSSRLASAREGAAPPPGHVFVPELEVGWSF